MACCVRTLPPITPFGLHPLIYYSDQQTKRIVIVKSAPDFLHRNERDILKRFQSVSSLRRLIDEVQDPPLLVLEHLDSDLLTESAARKLESSEVKHVAKVILQALAALHEEGIVHTGTLKRLLQHFISHHLTPGDRYQT